MHVDKTIEAPHNINNHGSQNARDLLTVAATIAALGRRKQDVRAFLYERVRQPVHLLQVGGMYDTETHRNLWPR